MGTVVNANETVKEERKYLDSKMFQNYLSRIEGTNDLSELKEIGKELMEFGANAYKRAVIEIYKEKKEKLINSMVESDELAKVLRNAFIFGTNGEKKIAARILYILREREIIDSGVVDYLFSLYKKEENPDS